MSPGEDALVSAPDQAVGWTRSWLSAASAQLVAIDVSVPTFLLLDSPPEEWRVVRGRRYDVTTRWSGLLMPPGIRLDDLLHTGSQLLTSLQTGAPGPSLLAPDDLSSVEALQAPLGETDFSLTPEELLIHTPGPDLARARRRHRPASPAHLLPAPVRQHPPRPVAEFQEGCVDTVRAPLPRLRAQMVAWLNRQGREGPCCCRHLSPTGTPRSDSPDTPS